MKRLISITIIILALTGCGYYGCQSGSNPLSPSGHHVVGSYKNTDDKYRSDTKALGHNGHDMYTKDDKEMEKYCSICHYIY